MVVHNVGKINWNVLFENVFYDEMSKKYFIKNEKSINHISNQLFNLIVEFGNTQQKKQSKNPLLNKYSNDMLNLTNILKFSNNVSNDTKEYELYRLLIHGNTPAVLGLIPCIISTYIFLNLYVGNFYSNVDFVSSKHSSVSHSIFYEFCSCDNDLPRFLDMEFYNIKKNIIDMEISKHVNITKPKNCICLYCMNLKNFTPQKNFTQKELSEIKNFCGLIFKCLYLTCSSNPNYDYEEIIKNSIYWLFGINYH